MTINPSWQFGLAVLLLLGLALAWIGAARLPLVKEVVVAVVRAAVQLAAVSFLIVQAVQHAGFAALFAFAMFAVAVYTTAKRTETLRSWPWVAAAMACGVIPVIAVIFGSTMVPLEGIAIVPICSIIIGNAMTAQTLLGRRAFASLREEIPQFEAGLSLGLSRHEAILEVIHRRSPEALIPNLDQTRTVGLVTLPGAFIGVLLGGGSPVQAGAAQLLVLVGIMANQLGVVAAAERFIAAGALLPPDLAARLRP